MEPLYLLHVRKNMEKDEDCFGIRFPVVLVAVSRCARELTVPITCKIRIFDDVQRTVEYAQMLERAGAKVRQ